MNKNQNQSPPIPKIIPPFANQQQVQQIENASLKVKVQQLEDQLAGMNTKCLQIQHVNVEQEKTIQSLKSQLDQKNQNSNISQNSNEDQILKNKCIELQFHNQDLLQKITQLNKDQEEIVEIKSYRQYSQNIQEETVQLKFVKKIVNLQISYQRQGKIVEFQGTGEIENKGVFFKRQCELSKIPTGKSQPQFILKESDLILNFQI